MTRLFTADPDAENTPKGRSCISRGAVLPCLDQASHAHNKQLSEWVACHLISVLVGDRALIDRNIMQMQILILENLKEVGNRPGSTVLTPFEFLFRKVSLSIVHN